MIVSHSKEVVGVQVKKVASLDITGERTRIYFEPNDLYGTTDILTLHGMSYSVIPGTRVRVTIEVVGEDA